MKRLGFLIAVCCMLLGSNAFGQNLSDRINYVMKKRAQAEARNTTKGELLGVLIYQDLTVDFQATPARDVLTYLQTVLGINIVGRYNDDRTGVGIDPDTEITLTAEGKPALTILEMVLEQCQEYGEECTWQLRNGFVEVGTKERLGAKPAREIRYYPIRDLLFEVPMFNNAPDLDIGSALNQGGGGFGGGGGGGGGFGGGGGGGFGGGGFGGGGGGGGFGGGGGGGGFGGGGGGSLFGEPEDEPERMTELEHAQAIIELILEIVEPEEWVDNGGEAATIRYYQGTLIIRAPDYIHRQIGGYPFPIRPRSSSSASDSQHRYVTFGGGTSDISSTATRQAEVPADPGSGAAGQAPPAEKAPDEPGK